MGGYERQFGCSTSDRSFSPFQSSPQAISLQLDWLEKRLSKSKAQLKFVVGSHPIIGAGPMSESCGTLCQLMRPRLSTSPSSACLMMHTPPRLKASSTYIAVYGVSNASWLGPGGKGDLGMVDKQKRPAFQRLFGILRKYNVDAYFSSEDNGTSFAHSPSSPPLHLFPCSSANPLWTSLDD